MTDADYGICACPQCGTRFRVTAEELGVADGKVRCGACLTVFAGRDHMQQSVQPPAGIAGRKPAAGGARQPSTAPRRATARARRRKQPGPAGLVPTAAALAVLLVANVLWLQYPAWSQAPAMRGVYSAACAVVGCRLAPLASLADIRVQVLAHARQGAPEAWVVEVELTNEARFAQPLPTLAVGFTAADGSKLEEQRIAPRDYAAAEEALRLTPNRSANAVLRLDDPGALAAGYSISLL